MRSESVLRSRVAISSALALKPLEKTDMLSGWHWW